jgi:hypothetical protein
VSEFVQAEASGDTTGLHGERLSVREAPVRSVQVMAHWFCGECDVEGRDVATEPTCWNCGGSVTVTARPTVPTDHGPADSAA